MSNQQTFGISNGYLVDATGHIDHALVVFQNKNEAYEFAVKLANTYFKANIALDVNNLAAVDSALHEYEVWITELDLIPETLSLSVDGMVKDFVSQTPTRMGAFVRRSRQPFPTYIVG